MVSIFKKLIICLNNFPKFTRKIKLTNERWRKELDQRVGERTEREQAFKWKNKEFNKESLWVANCMCVFFFNYANVDRKIF